MKDETVAVVCSVAAAEGCAVEISRGIDEERTWVGAIGTGGEVELARVKQGEGTTEQNYITTTIEVNRGVQRIFAKM